MLLFMLGHFAVKRINIVTKIVNSVDELPDPASRTENSSGEYRHANPEK